MNQPKQIFLIAAFFAVCSLNLITVFAQTPPKKFSEPSYEVFLQTILASNDATEKSYVSQSLSGIVKKLKSDFSFSDYRLTSTIMQKVSNKGSCEYKSIVYMDGTQDSKPNGYTEWRLSNLQNLSDENGIDLIQVQDFRFSQHTPNKNSPISSYQQTSLTTSFSLMKNTPTVIGSFTTLKPDELVFLILTVKSTEK